MTATSDILCLEGLTAGYRSRPVISDVTFDVAPGEVVGVVGLNGSGKSTLLRAVMGLANHLGGSVRLGSLELCHLSTRQRVHAGLTYLVQGGQVFESLRVREHLACAVRASRAGLLEALLPDAVERLPDLGPLMDRRAGLLSGGERQVVALAGALCGNRPVLLLDEPTAGLSQKNTSATLGWITRKARRDGSAVLVVEQDLEAVTKVADRIIVLATGSVVRHFDTPQGLGTHLLEAMQPSRVAALNELPCIGRERPSHERTEQGNSRGCDHGHRRGDGRGGSRLHGSE